MSDYWNNQPSPGLMTSFDPASLKPPTHTVEQFVELEHDNGARKYDPLPLVIARARGSWVQDTQGERYIDMVSGHSTLNQGHRHPHIVAALKAQADRLTLTSHCVHHDQLGPFLSILSELTGFEAVLPLSSGAEAIAIGVKAARRWARTVKGTPDGMAEIIVAKGGFGDRAVGVDDGVAAKLFSPGFRVVPYGDEAAIKAAITPKTAAILIAPVCVDGGMLVPPKDYLARVRELCDEHRVLLFVDELQTGLGRTGKMFAVEHSGIRPDCMAIGKALGGGIYPVSAFVADRSVMDVLDVDDLDSPFGGNPLAAAVGTASLEVIAREGLVERAEILGETLMTSIREIDSPHVLDVRGLGLLIGIEIKPESGSAQSFCEALMHHRVIARDVQQHVLHLAPPLNIDDIDVDWALSRLKEVLL